MSYFIAPADYKTPAQFTNGRIPSLYLMPDGGMVSRCPDSPQYFLEFVAHIAAQHCDILPDGFRLFTDGQIDLHSSVVYLAIEKALDDIAHAIVTTCPTVYPVTNS